ncbi:ATP-dependent Clp protease proteolytic subunit 3, chloroplastic [Vitis vinifera]|uniref:ATP-dependent Clp protease proteolytic subunit 3, chloroplastic n=1 Tax=Vitis vinifera TaxID=29760 RepID=A0A438JEZ7_VITVI|nr:ATP-dependent Clp protease proteolytic subunit 3, chloroplastic [Vitis vinifera]
MSQIAPRVLYPILKSTCVPFPPNDPNQSETDNRLKSLVYDHPIFYHEKQAGKGKWLRRGWEGYGIGLRRATRKRWKLVDEIHALWSTSFLSRENWSHFVPSEVIFFTWEAPMEKNLASLQGAFCCRITDEIFVWRKQRRLWRLGPLCMIWSTWKDRNRTSFECDENSEGLVGVRLCLFPLFEVLCILPVHLYCTAFLLGTFCNWQAEQLHEKNCITSHVFGFLGSCLGCNHANEACLWDRLGCNAVATEMGIRIREMMYHKIKLNKILSRITGKPDNSYFVDYLQIEADTDRLVAPTADAGPPPKTRVWGLWKVEGSRKAKRIYPQSINFCKMGTKEVMMRKAQNKKGSIITSMRMKPGIWFVHLVMFYRSLQSSLLIVLSCLINASI